MKNGILRIFINMGKKNVDVSIEIFRVIKKNLIPPYPFPAKNEKELFATRNSRLAPQNIFFGLKACKIACVWSSPPCSDSS